MIIHIVKNGENLNDLLDTYHLSFEEIKRNNTHITDFSNLIGGMKLRIPLIREEVEQILENTECFVADYYSKISDEIFYDLKEEQVEKKEEKSEIDIPKINDNITFFPRNTYPGARPPKKPYGGR